MKYIVKIALFLLAVLLMTSCGGPDHKDPKSVADAALQCYVNENLQGMKKLVNPADKKKLEGFDKFNQMLEYFKENGIGQKNRDKQRSAFEDYSVKWMKDPYGYPLNDNTKELQVRYHCTTGPNLTIELEKVDGKWYLATVPL